MRVMHEVPLKDKVFLVFYDEFDNEVKLCVGDLGDIIISTNHDDIRIAEHELAHALKSFLIEEE